MFCKRKHIGNYAAYARDREYGGAEELNAKLKVEVFTHLAKSKGSVIYRKNLKGHCGCVNAIEFSRDNGRLIASGEFAVLFYFLSRLFLVPDVSGQCGISESK